MSRKRMWRPITVVAGFGMAAVCGAQPAQAPSFAALEKLERGQWQLVEAGGPQRTMCLANPARLLQLHNRAANCSRIVIENTASVATVSYTCPGAGHGRTTVTVETPRLFRVQSQGLDAGTPFDQDIRGRHVGVCR